MNKIVFLFTAAALALTSCSQEEVVNDMAQQNNAIEFGTYAGRPAQTRGSVVSGDDFTFGVFAYYTGKTDWTNSETADFMLNQKVTKTSGSSNCEYAPIKYWPNNDGDKVTFFAYAPHNASATAPEADGDNLKISHNVPSIVTNQIDLLYSKNFHKNLNKQTVNGTVNFDFAHALSRIGFSATCAVDQVGVGGTLADGTEITITEIVLSEAGSDKGVFYTDGDLITTTESNVTATWGNQTGKQTFTLGTDNLSEEKLKGNTSIAKLNNDNSYLMVIPQDFKSDNSPYKAGFDVTVKYTVTTTDNTNSNNSSSIENIITNTVKLNLEMGKAYTLNLILGMTSVKMTATIEEWGDPTSTPVNVPVNKN